MPRTDLLSRYRAVRAATVALCEPLEVEDYVVQSMPDASPVKWHLAHTSWFYETFVLAPARDHHRRGHERYAVLFNSYYQSVGARFPRPERGVLSRPTVAEVREYRRAVDQDMERLLEDGTNAALSDLAFVVELGLHHEQQHQELILTDLKHAFAQNPLEPVYAARPHGEDAPVTVPPLRWVGFGGGLVEIGHAGSGFAFDNEGPRHRVFVEPFRLASRLVTAGEWLEFMDAGGYREPSLWLSDGWDACQKGDWEAPAYHRRADRGWELMTLAGWRAVDPAEPVCHVSHFEADAFARWAGARLPTEQEWELAAAGRAVAGNFVESRRLHPAPAGPGELSQLFGDVWEWTASPYTPYPGFQPLAGGLGEYNGKFMSGQIVLRGGSCASPASHLRATYRNFFPPAARWQFSGVRLARPGA